MASIALGVAGSAIGGSIGGSILGVSAATIGGFVGSTVGSVVDSWIMSSLTPPQSIEGQRLDSLRVTSSTEGAVIPRVYGRMRQGGNVIWATDFREEIITERGSGGGGKGFGGGGGSVTSTTYRYHASFAVGICEGPISGIGRIWADGKPMDLEGVTWRWYPGDETQTADPFIAAKTGPETPAYRGTAYLVFEELPLERFGNRIPQLTFEVFRALDEPDTLEGAVKAITIIPGSGEFTYATSKVTRVSGYGETTPENINAISTTTDFNVSLDHLQAAFPGIESVALVISWFGSDLRAGACEIRPKVELADKTSNTAWEVAGVTRGTAEVVSYVDGRPAYGGAPADFSVVEAIRECKARGLRVTLSPFVMMDIPEGNTLPDPYSDNASGTGQGAYPWRGRITCSPAAGYVGTADKTATAASQVAAFFNGSWGYRRMVLHYADLCAAAGGVDSFIIGSELRGLTQVRSAAGTYPAVSHLVTLANDCRTRLGAATQIGYAADWSEYFGHHPDDGSGDVYFHLDPLWASANIDFVGIDNYVPLSDWRDGFDHADAQDFTTIYERAYLQSNIEGGEGFDWYYASEADRATQTRTPITDGAYGEPWVFRYKDIRDWWARPHHDRPGGARQSLVPDGLDPRSWTGLSATIAPEPGTFFGRFTSTARVTTSGAMWGRASSTWIDKIALVAGRTYVATAYVAEGSSRALRVMVSRTGIGDPHVEIDGPFGGPYTTRSDTHSLGDWSVAGHGGGLWEVRLEFTAGVTDSVSVQVGPASVVTGADIVVCAADLVDGVTSTTGWVPESKPIRFTEFGCPAVDRGTNEPNVFFDPKSTESAVPYFSRGWRDDTIQRASLEAMLLYWREAANNPASSVYTGSMIDVPECAAWTWDARPYPFFPALTDVWSDGENWRLGHWLNGRAGSVSLPALVRDLCLRAGLSLEDIDVSHLWGAVEGLVIAALESPRVSISMLARHFGFDAVESEGRIVFRMRGGAPVATLTLDALAQADGGNGDVIEITRSQETELPLALKWTVLRADEDYDPATVESRRITVDVSRVESVSFPVAVPPEAAERRVRRALQEMWVAREGATFHLPPSRLALDPSDVVALAHDGRDYDLRLVSVNDGLARAVRAVLQDRAIYDMPPGAARTAVMARAILFGQPRIAFLDLPRISEAVAAHQPLLATYAEPWPGAMAVYRSLTTDGFQAFADAATPARFGETVADLHAGPTSRFDLANALVVDMQAGALQSVTDLMLFDGANSFALETGDGVWEIVQAGEAELIAPGRYRLTRLLRGQRGTEAAMVSTVPAGARLVALNESLVPLPVSLGDLDRLWHWRVGPAGLHHSDDAYVGADFTPRGRGLSPFSVAHVAQPCLHGRSPGDYTIAWRRRSRDLSADSWSLAEVPLGEDVESYEVDIIKGAAVARTLASTTPSVVYTAADQVADFGATLGPGETLTIRIAQISVLIGRGEVREFTLQF